MRYAVFPGRLAVELQGRVTVYDTLDHRISGVSQQQGGDSSLTFRSQHGTVSVASLPIVHATGAPAPHANFAQPRAMPEPHGGGASDRAAPGAAKGGSGGTEAVALIEQLARLRAAGVLTDEEFHSKKRELLDRL